MSGWIKLYRELADHWLWAGEPFSKGQAWIDLLIYAHFSYEPKKIEIKGKIYVLQRGQQARSELTLSKKWMWSRGKTRRFLARLETDKMIVQHPDNKTSIITILNYDKYQKKQTADNTADDTTLDTTTGQHPDTTRYTIEEGKKDKNESLKKGGKNDNVEHMDTDSLNSSAFSYSYKSIKLGYRESDSNRVQEINGQSAEVFCSGNGNGNNSDNQRPCSGTYQDWSDLDDRTTLGIFGQGHNGDIFTGNNGGDLGDSQAIAGLGSQEALGTQGAPLGRKTNEQEVIINDGMGAQAEDAPEPPQKGAKKERNGIPYQEIITILNECTGKNYRHTGKQNKLLIKARWGEGFTIDDFRRVIEDRSKRWLNDPKMDEFLRPITLFSNKFESYLQAASKNNIVISKINTNKNLINCNECVHIDTCSNAESEPIPACSLFAIMERATA